jgi:hypothetical protein
MDFSALGNHSPDLNIFLRATWHHAGQGRPIKPPTSLQSDDNALAKYRF